MNANKTNLAKQTIVLLATSVGMKWMDIWFVIMLGNEKVKISEIPRKKISQWYNVTEIQHQLWFSWVCKK